MRLQDALTQYLYIIMMDGSILTAESTQYNGR